MGEGGLRSLPPTRDERPVARPPSPLPLRGLRLPAAPLMSQDQELNSSLPGASLAEREEDNTPIGLWHGHRFSRRIGSD